MDWQTAAPIAVSILLAVAGYLATYLYNLKLSERKDRLDRVNKQLGEFYGPLLALTSSGRSAWLAFRTRYRPDTPSYWSDAPPPTPEEAEAWRLWTTEVFMPVNLRIVDLITRHADLLDESEMPQVLLDVCAHVAAYQAVLKQWEMEDFSEHTSVINFPSLELIRFASTGFARIKTEQSELLGSRPTTQG